MERSEENSYPIMQRHPAEFCGVFFAYYLYSFI